MICKWIIGLISILLIDKLTFAVPSEIIIIRHGEKLIQSNPGPCLSPQGWQLLFHSLFIF